MNDENEIQENIYTLKKIKISYSVIQIDTLKNAFICIDKYYKH